MFCQSNSKSSQPGYLQHTTSSAQKSVRAQDNVNSRVEVRAPVRESYHQRPLSPSLKNVQSSNWNTLNYNPQNYQKPSTTPNSQHVQMRFSNIDNKENRPPPREKNTSLHPSKYFQNQYSKNLEYLFPKSNILSVFKENIPTTPPKKSLETQSTQNSSTHLPRLLQNTKQSYQDDKYKKLVDSPTRKSNTATLKEVDPNILQQSGSRGRDMRKNQDTFGELLNSPLQNNNFGLYNYHQVSGRGISSENRSIFHFNNLARKEKIVGIRNFNNTCFAGSLLQCLYHLPTFKDCLYKCAKEHPNELIRLFEDLFRSMDIVNGDDVNDSAYNLIKRLFQMRSQEFRLGVQGSSEILFRAIIEEFGDGSPLVQLFWRGRYFKQANCQKCPNQVKITQDIFILYAKDIDYKPERADDGNLFQPRNELRKCRECQTQTPHSTNYIFESLPNVLAIAISDTIDTKSSNKFISNISVKTKDGQTIKYEYFAGIANMGKGSIGVHSIAIVKSNENEGGGYFELNDSIARSLLSLDAVSLYPKLIFYQRINFPPHKPDIPPPPSNHVRSLPKVQPFKAFHIQDEKKEPEIIKETPKEISEIGERGRKKESGREFEENTHRQNRCVSSGPRIIQQVNPLRLEFGRRIALENKQGTSYAGALLQCLYHLPNLRKLLYDFKSRRRDLMKPIISWLIHFFESMDQMSAEVVNESAEKFIEFVIETYRFKHEITKDSRDFWNIIYEEIFSSKSGCLTVSSNLFIATSETVTTCKGCKQNRREPRNTALLPLNERDYTNEMVGHGNFLAPLSQSFTCRCYSPSSFYYRTEVMLATFPDILVISILPRTEKFFPESKLLQKILLKGSDQTVQIYEYQAGVLTKFREDDRQHSIAVIQCGGSKDSYFAFDDKTVVKTTLHETAYHPRLLFYRKYIRN